MQLRIYHTVNEGLYLWNGKSGLLIDALHRGKRLGFSDTPERYIWMMRHEKNFFTKPNDLLFTHLHEDHFDPELVDDFLERYPDRIVYAPGLDRNNVQPVVLEHGIARLQIEEYEIYAFSTEHDGQAYVDCPHCSYLIRCGDECIWISGDAKLDVSLAGKIQRYASCQNCISDAFVMIYQISSRSGRDFLKALAPERIWLYHLPYETDDIYHYHAAAKQKCRQCEQEGLAVRIALPDSYID